MSWWLRVKLAWWRWRDRNKPGPNPHVGQYMSDAWRRESERLGEDIKRITRHYFR